MGKLLKNPFYFFIFIATALYTSWYLLYEFYLTSNTNIDVFIVENLISSANSILSYFGFDMLDTIADGSNRTIAIDGAPLIYVGDPCNGFTLFILFSIFVIAFPGKIKHKLWFIPFGIFTIHLLNILRVISLCLLALYNYSYLDFNHDYTFLIIVYSYVAFLGYTWINHFSETKVK